MARGIGPRERGALLVGRAAGQVGAPPRARWRYCIAGPDRRPARARPPRDWRTAARPRRRHRDGHQRQDDDRPPPRRDRALHAGCDRSPTATGSNLERGIASDARRRRRRHRRHARRGPPPRRVRGGRGGTGRCSRRGCARAPRVFLNLFRDQLDRYGEVDSVAAAWQRALLADAVDAARWCSTPTTPRSRCSPRARAAPVITFGVEDAVGRAR